MDASGAHDRPTQVGALNRPPFLCRYAADRIDSSPAHRAPTHSPCPLAHPEGIALILPQAGTACPRRTPGAAHRTAYSASPQGEC